MYRKSKILAAIVGSTTAIFGVGYIITRNADTKKWMKNKAGIVLFQNGQCESDNKQNTLIKDIKYDNKRRSSILHQAQCLVERFKEEHGCPGVVISVSVDGYNVWDEGFGLADVENNVYCTPNTVMRIASISKPLTAIAAMRLVDEGKIKLDDSIQKFVANFPVKTINSKECDITIEHLLTHLSGIRHYHKKLKKSNDNSEQVDGTYKEFECPEYYIKECYDTIDKALELFKNDELLHEPGSKFLYSTYAWTLVSAVVENVTKKSFLKHMDKLFVELGMLHTSAEFHDKLIHNKARFYIRDNKGKLQNTPYVDNCHKYAGGGFVSTTLDLIKFGNAMLYSSQVTNNDSIQRPGILTKESVASSWKIYPKTEQEDRNKVGFGLGWMIFPDKNKYGGFSNQSKAIFHTGAAIGASSVLLILPNNGKDCHPPKGVVVAMLVNLGEVKLSTTALEIAELFKNYNEISTE